MKLVVIIAVITIGFFVALFVHAIHEEAHAPCTEFAGVSVMNLPVRCLSYYGIQK